MLCGAAAPHRRAGQPPARAAVQSRHTGARRRARSRKDTPPLLLVAPPAAVSCRVVRHVGGLPPCCQPRRSLPPRPLRETRAAQLAKGDSMRRLCCAAAEAARRRRRVTSAAVRALASGAHAEPLASLYRAHGNPLEVLKGARLRVKQLSQAHAAPPRLTPAGDTRLTCDCQSSRCRRCRHQQRARCFFTCLPRR